METVGRGKEMLEKIVEWAAKDVEKEMQKPKGKGIIAETIDGFRITFKLPVYAFAIILLMFVARSPRAEGGGNQSKR